jgi:hypothetical protein
VQNYPLRHLVRHSPTGFEFGYAGSGPSDLARSIVGDLLNDPDPHPGLYQVVKDTFLVDLDGDGPHRLAGDHVLQLLAEHGRPCGYCQRWTPRDRECACPGTLTAERASRPN